MDVTFTPAPPTVGGVRFHGSFAVVVKMGLQQIYTITRSSSKITSNIVINIINRNHDFETFIESFYTSGDIKKISSTVIKNSKQVYKAKR